MFKYLSKIILIFFILFVTLITYLSIFGIKTDKFNKLVDKSLVKTSNSLKIDLDEIYIKILPLDLMFEISTDNPVITVGRNSLNLKKISSNIKFKDFFKNGKKITNLNIDTNKNDIDSLIKIIRYYENNIQTMLIDKLIKNGSIQFSAQINFDEQGKVKDDYVIRGNVNTLDIELLNKKEIISNFDFNIKKNELVVFNSNHNFNDIKFFSENITIKKKKSFFKLNGDINNTKENINIEKFDFLSNKLNLISDKQIKLSSQNKFIIKIDNKFKIQELNLSSKVEIDEIKLKNNYKLFSDIFKFEDNIYLKNNIINVNFNGNPRKKNKKNKLKIQGNGEYGSNVNYDKYEIFLENKNNLYEINSKFEIKNNPIHLKLLNYEKGVGVNANLKMNYIFNNNYHEFQKISFTSRKDKLKIGNLKLSQDMTVKNFDFLNLTFENKSKKFNNLEIKKNKKNFFITAKLLDGTELINKILNDDEKNKINLLKNFDNKFYIDLKKFYLDDLNYVNNLKGFIEYKKNKITNCKLDSYFKNNEVLSITINVNDQNEQITNIYTKHPKPLVKRYKFIRGFEEGVLDLQSITKNETTDTILIIDNFKVKEVPIFAKILTLASLQGIADLLTGEGIRFTDFEMRSSKKGSLTEINEIYAIGPAVSLMMEGYIQKDQLTSLEGTLVPATTINRTISSIPVLGDILVGKKVGEGVFGVSFKIKGPPNNLKTSVNPIKTLTPRFITRTLEKIKKLN
tara:strand:- start:656 stop:2872 length:2217 start_codon:yes stop_codon:yes gene_type:complete